MPKLKETIEKIPNKELQEKIKKMIKEGYKVACVKCGMSYKYKPTEHYEDGHNGREIPMCHCGCDILLTMEEFLEKQFKIKITPQEINGEKTIILKEHNLKYCECGVGYNSCLWCGDAEFECGFPVEEIERDFTQRTFQCKKSGYKIVVLRNSPTEDIVHADEYMSKQFDDWGEDDLWETMHAVYPKED